MKKTYNSYLNHIIARNKIVTLLCFPIYILAIIIPKIKKIKVFGSMNGFDIVDNSKYLFINEYKKGYYFITKNKDKLDNPIINDIYPIYYLSFKGLLLQLFASEVYYTHSVFDFFSPIIMGAKVIALWHGVPGKKINTALEEQKKYLKPINFFLYTYIFPYKYYAYCKEIWCPNEDLISVYKECFTIGKPVVKIHKQPRTIYAKKNQIEKKLFLYAPTYRKDTDLYKIMDSLLFFDKQTIDLLNKYNIKIVIRPHPIDYELLSNQNLPACYELDNSQDIYNSICSYELLITDYSSLYYDATELGIQTMFLQNDIETYDFKNGLFDSFKQLIYSTSKHNIIEVLNDFYEEIRNK